MLRRLVFSVSCFINLLTFDLRIIMTIRTVLVLSVLSMALNLFAVEGEYKEVFKEKKEQIRRAIIASISESNVQCIKTESNNISDNTTSESVSIQYVHNIMWTYGKVAESGNGFKGRIFENVYHEQPILKLDLTNDLWNFGNQEISITSHTDLRHIKSLKVTSVLNTGKVVNVGTLTNPKYVEKVQTLTVNCK